MTKTLTRYFWSFTSLESYVQNLKSSNQSIPYTVKIVLENAKKHEAKKVAKRIANRKSASNSRARKNQLIDELIEDNTKLRRHALILSNLPDPVAVIDIHGEIKFCSEKMGRVLKHELSSLLGTAIYDILAPESRDTMRELIDDLRSAEEQATAVRNGEEKRSVCNDATSDDAGRTSERPFSMLELNVDSNDRASIDSLDDTMSEMANKACDHKHSISSSKFQRTKFLHKRKSSSMTYKNSSENNSEHDTKKQKIYKDDKLIVKIKSTTKNASDQNVDMKTCATTKNADATLSYLVHCPAQNETIEEPKKARSVHKKYVSTPRSGVAINEKREDFESSSSKHSTMSSEKRGKP